MNRTVIISFAVLCSLSTVFLVALVLNVETIMADTEVRVLNDVGYLDVFGHYLVLGELENVGDQAVEWWEIEASFYNQSDSLLCTEVFSTRNVSSHMLDTINPGRKSPFQIVLHNESLASEVDHYSIAVLSYDVTSAKPIGLEILKSSSYIDEPWGNMIINGTIKNIGTETAESVNIIATFYDADGNVIAVSHYYTEPSHVEPHLTLPFQIELASVGPYPITNITSYVLEAESFEYAMVPEFPLSDDTPPTISILSPEYKTYATSDVHLTFTVSESASWIGYSLDGQANVTIAGNTTLSGLPDGTHTITVYANDTAGNMGASEMVYFTIETLEPEPFPTWIVAIIVIIAVFGVTLLVYFTKVKKTT